MFERKQVISDCDVIKYFQEKWSNLSRLTKDSVNRKFEDRFRRWESQLGFIQNDFVVKKVWELKQNNKTKHFWLISGFR